MDGVLDEVRRAMEFLLETGDEISRAVLKKNDEAEGEKHKQQDPKKVSDETHARRLA